jgi:hypothetical protein
MSATVTALCAVTPAAHHQYRTGTTGNSWVDNLVFREADSDQTCWRWGHSTSPDGVSLCWLGGLTGRSAGRSTAETADRNSLWVDRSRGPRQPGRQYVVEFDAPRADPQRLCVGCCWRLRRTWLRHHRYGCTRVAGRAEGELPVGRSGSCRLKSSPQRADLPCHYGSRFGSPGCLSLRRELPGMRGPAAGGQHVAEGGASTAGTGDPRIG